MNSEIVAEVNLIGGETIEIRRLDNGLLVGFDAAYTEQLADGEHPNNPYGDGKVIIPDDEHQKVPQINE